MYEYISGKLSALRQGYAVIEAGGIGYKINVPTSFLGNIEEKCTLYLYQVVREGEISLYGFESEGERDMFRAS